jgi:acetyl esterase
VHAPAVVLTVGHDPLRDEGIAYARALEADGGQVTWIHAPELFHGAFAQAGVLPSAAIRVREACAAALQVFT